MDTAPITPGDGWAVKVGPTVYDRDRTGAPLGLATIWSDTEGVGHVTIYRPDGSVYLDNAGSELARRAHVAAVREAEQTRIRRRTVAAHLAALDHHHPGDADKRGGLPSALAALRAHPAYARATAHYATA